MEDTRIIELLFERSEEGLQYLEEKYGKLVIQISEQILCNKEDALECQNDTYLAIWDTIPPNRPQYLRAYLCKIVRNISLNRVRLNSTKKRNSFVQIALDELGDSITGGDGPYEVYESKLLGTYINEFLGTLDEDDRTLFIRRYFLGDSLESLSKLFSCRTNTVSVKLSRIRSQLKSYLAENEVWM